MGSRGSEEMIAKHLALGQMYSSEEECGLDFDRSIRSLEKAYQWGSVAAAHQLVLIFKKLGDKDNHQKWIMKALEYGSPKIVQQIGLYDDESKALKIKK